MGLIVNDSDVCPKCGSYWGTNGYCANLPGHLRDLNAKPVSTSELVRKGVVKPIDLLENGV